MSDKETKPHIHCPECQVGILIEKVYTGYSTLTDILNRYIYFCEICRNIFKKQDMGKITKVFNDRD